ncbi:MAG: Sip1-related alpha-galactosidase [Bacteroidota bacterium]
MKRKFPWATFCMPLLTFGILLSCSERQNVHPSRVPDIDIASGSVANVVVLDAPEKTGSSQRKIILPEFEAFVHVAADSLPFRWIGASNRMFPWVGEKDLRSIFEPKNPKPPKIPNPNRRALTMVFKLGNNDYLALLPLSGEASVSWLEVTESGDLVLDYGSLGTKPIPENTKVPLLAWYRSKSVYESLAKTWELATSDENIMAKGNLRDSKSYPEPLNYLGWCTWEQYKKTINEELLTTAIDNIETSGIPVRWVLIDDGHQDDENLLLKSFTPDREKFPNGWNPIVSRKQEDKIKWMGIWHAFLSHWNGVHVDHTMDELIPYLTPNPGREKGLLPKDDVASSEAFFEYLVTTIKEQGFNFMKSDNVSRSTIEYYGFPNAAEAQRQNVLALEQACYRYGIGLMNCSAQNTIDMLNASNSATMRTSPDYQKHNLPTSKSQILQSVFNVSWLGQTLWPDHDMFHSSDEEVGETMSVTKALSGGPIYLSDDPADFKQKVIAPLCYANGKLIRPEAPGVPLPSSIFNDALYENKDVYKTIAPLKNGSCAIAAYNLSVTAKNALTGKITPEDYTQASAMMQPYTGPWEMPKEGLVIYDWKNQVGQTLDANGLNFQIDGFGHKLFLVSPISEGWGVIGRPDKYLSQSTVNIQDISENSITIKFVELGSVVLYSSKGELSSDQMNMISLGNNFYKGVPKDVFKGNLVRIKRINI